MDVGDSRVGKDRIHRFRQFDPANNAARFVAYPIVRPVSAYRGGIEKMKPRRHLFIIVVRACSLMQEDGASLRIGLWFVKGTIRKDQLGFAIGDKPKAVATRIGPALRFHRDRRLPVCIKAAQAQSFKAIGWNAAKTYRHRFLLHAHHAINRRKALAVIGRGAINRVTGHYGTVSRALMRSERIRHL